MPEIDSDVFQVLTLAGLAILLILVLALMSAVSKLSKAVKALTPGAAGETPAAEADTSAAEDTSEPATDLGLAAAAGAGAGAVAAGSVSPSEEAVAASVEPEPEPVTSSWSEPAAEETTSTWAASTMAEEPVQASEPAVAEAAPLAQAASETPAATDELPEEQPFERGGRWWFKRGDELLVYEEQSGQWSAAPDGAFENASSAASEFRPAEQQAAAEPVQTETAPAGTAEEAPAETQTFAAISDETATAWRTDETVDEAPAAGQAADDTSLWGVGESAPVADETPAAESAGEGESATFWKCPSCGAVNGSTAASCRMCFAQRP
jgi:hypothetical protein